MIDAIIKPDILSETLDAVTNLVEECKIEIRETSIFIEVMDPATVAAVEIELKAGAFDSYNAEEGLIGLNITRFQEVLRMIDSDTLVHLSIDETTQQVELVADNINCKISLIDPELIRSRPDIDHVNYPAAAVTEGSHLTRAIHSADTFADHVEIGVDKDDDSIYIKAEGDLNEINYKIPEEDLIEFTKGPALSIFSVGYYVDITRSIPSDAVVEIKIGEQMPSELHYSYAEGNGQISYYVAPRIQK